MMPLKAISYELSGFFDSVFRVCCLCSGSAVCVQDLLSLFRVCCLCSGSAVCVQDLLSLFRVCCLFSGSAVCVQGLLFVILNFIQYNHGVIQYC